MTDAQPSPANSSDKACASASDFAAAINAIIIETGFDDATRAGLMAAMDAADGCNEPFSKSDKYLGMRMTRNSNVSVEFDGEVSDRAHAKRWVSAWKLIDSEQARTGFPFIIRRRGGLRGENRETMRKHASIYTVPLLQIVVDVVRRSRQYRAQYGKKREMMFRRAAREVLAKVPRDYEREADPLPREKRGQVGGETSETDATATKIFKSHARIVARGASLGASDDDKRGVCLTMMQHLKDNFGTQFEQAIRSFVEEAGGEQCAPACTTLEGGSVLHAEAEPDFPPFEPSDDAPESRLESPAAGEAHAHELFQKSNVYAGENENDVPVQGTSSPDESAEINPVEVAERAAIQAEGCEVSEALPTGDAPPAMPKHRRTVATEALHYASVLGWKLFPLHTPVDEGVCSCGKGDCSNIGKHPRTLRGLKDATNDPEQVKFWWQKFPDANIGIAMGAASGLLVIDVDPRHGGWQSLEDLFRRIGEVFPPTVEAITGSDGRHFFFRMPDADIRNSANKLGAGLDVRANGGYVVAPNSLHASGNRYRWMNEELPLADVPYKLLQELIVKPRVTFADFTHNTDTKHRWTGGTISEGGRNETLFKRAAALRGQGADESTIIDALCDINNSCSPPLPLREIEQIAASATRYTPNARSIFA